MIDSKCIDDVKSNFNTGVEYEIALFYSLCEFCQMDLKSLDIAINNRVDSKKIRAIIKKSSPQPIISELAELSLSLVDVSFETQNDEVGPADIVLKVINNNQQMSSLGLSVKYSNTCTLNATGKRFLTDLQINELKGVLPVYTEKYIEEMNAQWGKISNWFRQRKPSQTTDEFIDLIRGAVIANWQNITQKEELFAALYHSDSPIKFWVIKYNKRGYAINTTPTSIDFSRVNEIEIRRYHTSYVSFHLDGVMIGHMQVKFNNGFIERCKKQNPDIVEQGIKISYGKPFSSWNFSVEESCSTNM